MPAVFISSVFRELEVHRDAAIKAIRKAGYDCICMEEFPASAETVEEFCRTQVAKADLFILLIGQFYGSCPEGSDCSYTELEFNASRTPPAKPCLIFSSDRRAYTVSAAVMDVYEKLPGGLNEQRRKNAELLRKALAPGTLPDSFTTPETLASSAVAALSRHFRSAPVTSVYQPIATDSVGPMLPYLCDRTNQYLDFGLHWDEALTLRPRSPLIYVLLGSDEQKHDSFVNRLVWSKIEQGRRDQQTRPFEPPQDRFVALPPCDRDVEMMYRRLLRGLFESVVEFGMHSRLDEASFCDLTAKVTSPFLVLRHCIPRWDSLCLKLFQSKYLRFWDQVAETISGRAGEVHPRILVFFEIAYSAAQPLSSEQTAEIRECFSSRNRSVQSKLSAKRCLTYVLPTLDDVTETDFTQWMARYGSKLGPDAADLTFKSLVGAPAAPMKTVERELKRILRLN